MFAAKVLFEIFVCGFPKQYEEICMLTLEGNPAIAFENIKMSMLKKASTFVNENGDRIEWQPLGIVEFYPVEADGNIIEVDSRLLDVVSEYTKDRMCHKLSHAF
jgi:hypothetical protein